MRSNLILASLAGAAVFAWAFEVRGDDRKFTYSYESKTLPQGTWEFEQWATVQTRKDAGIWNTLLLREEIEYGVTDRLNGAIYLNFEYQGNKGVPGFADEREFGYKSTSTEWKYKLTDPSADPLGFLLYGEVGLSNDEYEFEGKLVFSKEVSNFTFAYNFIFEGELAKEVGGSPEWRWEYIVSNTLGASYSMTQNFAVGVEALDIARWTPVENERTHAYYAGPNVHYSHGPWWATLTFLWQLNVNGYELTDGDNTKYAIRLIVGVNF